MRKTKGYSYLPIIAIGAAILAVIVLALILGDTKPKPAKPHKQAQKTAPVPKNTVATACGPYRVDKTIQIGDQSFQTEVVQNNAEFSKGLGGRPCILSDQAMLFPFAKPATIPIWMKGMKFPIDIVWLDSNHSIVAMEINESPSTYPDKFENKLPAQYVLELKANRTQELGLNVGTTINL